MPADRPHPPRPRILAAAAVGIVLLVVAAVTVGIRLTTERRDLSLVRSAPDAARDAGYFSMRLTVTLEAPGQPARSTESSGELAVKDDRAHLFVFPVLSEDQLELLSQGPILYLSIPEAKQAALGGARWIRVRTESSEAAQGAALGPIPDPLSFLDVLAAAPDDLDHETGGDIDGTAVRRFRTRIAMADVVRRLPRPRALALRRLGPRPLEVEAAIDGDGRPRQIAVRADFAEKGMLTSVLSVGDYGRPVTIGIPPTDATVEAASVDEALERVGRRNG